MIRIENLKKTFGVRTLFEGVSYHFPAAERIALVGANGAGKTTLLNILCKLDEQDGGEVLVPSDAMIGYLPQKPNPEPRATVIAECQTGAERLARLKDEMDHTLQAMEHDATPELASRFDRSESEFRREGGYAIEATAHGILRGLGFSASDVEKDPRALSGGWRMRLELAKLFLGRPDFLILDEPTNHLDLPSLVWVESYLMNFKGTLLFVSHDRALLNRLSTITLHLSGQSVTPYRGNFDRFLEQREARMEQEQASLDALRRRREQMQTFVDRFGAKATKAAQAQSRLKMISRIRDLESQHVVDDDPSSVMITLPPPAKTPRIVFEIEGGAIGYTTTLASGIRLTVERGAKIAIIGANGIGKSTLLKTVAKKIPAKAGRFVASDSLELAYFAQDQGETLDLQQTVLQNLLMRSDLSEKQARTLLGHFLFRGDDVFKSAKVLSGGELSRLGLACALGHQSGLLLLDEPTNHLDMTSVEALAACIDEYEGTVLFVSHDRTFIDEVATHIFAMLPDGRSQLFEGKLEDYQRLARTAGFPNVLQVDEKPTQSKESSAPGQSMPRVSATDAEIKEMKKSRQKAQSRVDQLEKKTATLKADLAKLEGELLTIPPTDFVKAKAIADKQTSLQKELEGAEEQWLEAYDEVESTTQKLAATGRDV